MNLHILTHLPSVVKILKGAGYNAYGLHSNRGSFWNRNNAYKQLGFDAFFDEKYFYGEAKGFRSLDHVFFQQSVKKISDISARNKPFLVYLITQTMHGPYKDEIDYFERTNYTDQALKAFLIKLKVNNLLKNTNIIIYGDHTTGIKTDNYDCLKENGENVPLIIIPASKKSGIITTYGSHIDIAPTILDLAGLPGSNKMVGKSLLKWIPDRLFPVKSNLYAVTPRGTIPFYDMLNPMYNKIVKYCQSFFYKIAQAKNDSSLEILNKHPYIAHALGSINDKTYTNSKEAFIRSYNLGLRLLEVDFSLTKDKKLVCFHYGMEKNLGIEKTINDINENEFLSKKYFKKYSPLNLAGLLQLLSKYPDSYIVTDFKYGPKMTFEYYLTILVTLIRKYDKKLLSRFIIQIYSPEQLEVVKKYQEFKNVIFTSYRTNISNREIYDFVIQNKNYIKAVTKPVNRLSDFFLLRLKKNRIPVFTHTINNLQQIYYLQNKYVFGFYTDATTELTNPFLNKK